MKKAGALVLSFMFLFVFATGCATTKKQFQDGVYRAEVAEFDSYGYKDFLVVTVKDGLITDVEFSSFDKDGNSIIDDEKYRTDMEDYADTYPEKYAADLSNQLLEAQDIAQVETVAGATYSSNSFKALFQALIKNMETGDTTTVIVANVPEVSK